MEATLATVMPRQISGEARSITVGWLVTIMAIQPTATPKGILPVTDLRRAWSDAMVAA